MTLLFSSSGGRLQPLATIVGPFRPSQKLKNLHFCFWEFKWKCFILFFCDCFILNICIFWWQIFCFVFNIKISQFMNTQIKVPSVWVLYIFVKSHQNFSILPPQTGSLMWPVNSCLTGSQIFEYVWLAEWTLS